MGGVRYTPRLDAARSLRRAAVARAAARVPGIRRTALARVAAPMVVTETETGLLTVTAPDGTVLAQATVEVERTPPGTLQPGDFGYIPDLPEGWTLIEGDTNASVPSGASERYYLKCKRPGGIGLQGGAHDLIFVGFDAYGAGCGTWGSGFDPAWNVGIYGSRFGGIDAIDRQAPDGLQIKPAVSGGTRPRNWTIQGSSITDILRTNEPDNHTDGIQFGGVLDVVVRYTAFDNVAVEHVLLNGWNGVPENALLDRSYFGTVPEGRSAPVRITGASGWFSTNCHAVSCYSSGDHCATIDHDCIGCSETDHHPLEDWPYGPPAEVWQAYMAAAGL